MLDRTRRPLVYLNPGACIQQERHRASWASKQDDEDAGTRTMLGYK